MSPRREALLSACSVVAAWGWLGALALPSLAAAGDLGGLPTAAWLLPVAAALTPWVLPARTSRSRAGQAAVGQLGCVAGAGLMVLHPLAGIGLAGAGLAYAALERVPTPAS